MTQEPLTTVAWPLPLGLGVSGSVPGCTTLRAEAASTFPSSGRVVLVAG